MEWMSHPLIQALVVFTPIVAILGYFQFGPRRGDYKWASEQHFNFSVHEDQLNSVQDAKYLAEGRFRDMDTDWSPWPAATAFGIASPALGALGIKLFGPNLFGLRFFTIPVSIAINLLTALLIIGIAPGPLGWCVAALFVLNFNSFMVYRAPIPENVLCFATVLMAFFGVFFPDWFLANLFVLCAVSGVLVLFKPHFPFLVVSQCLLQALLLGESFAVTFLAGCIGLGAIILAELGHLAYFWSQGMAHLRWRAFIDAIRIGAGHPKELTYLSDQLEPAKVTYSDLLPRFLMFFGKPYCLPSLVPMLAVGIVMGTAAIDPGEGTSALLLVGGIAVSLMLCMPFYYYPKRGIHLYPLVLAMVAAAGQILTDAIPAPFGPAIAMAVGTGLLIAHVRNQKKTGVFEEDRVTTAVADATEQLEAATMEGATIYMHSSAWRFFWSVTGRRIRAMDHQLGLNQEVAEWALKDEADFLVLYQGAPSPDPETMRNFIPLAGFSFTPEDADKDHTFHLFFRR